MQRVAARSAALRTAAQMGTRRHMAIAASVKKASDTSAEKYAAPSHVGLVAEATSIARQYREFYGNPESVLEFSDAAKEALTAEVTKRAKAIPGSNIQDSWIAGNIPVPDKMRLGDNPHFESSK